MKKLLCILFSCLLVLTSVPVSASTTATSGTVDSKTIAPNALASSLKKFTFSETSTSTTTGISSVTPASTTATKAATISAWNTFVNNTDSFSTVYGTATSTSQTIGKINVPENSTLIIFAAAYRNSSEMSIYNFKLSGYSTYYTNSSANAILIPNVSKGTHNLTLSGVYSGNSISAAFTCAYIPNGQNRTITSAGIAGGSTGNTMVQTFKVSKRGIASIQAYANSVYDSTYGISYNLQKKSGSSWKTIRSGVSSLSSNNYANTFGLTAGTYRIQYKTSASNIVFLTCKTKAITASSYGATKAKATTISRYKSKTQTLIAGESASKAQWYKIKVTAKRSTQIDITNLGSDGSLYVYLYGPSGSSIKKKTTSSGIRFYGTFKKGTYYIKVYKSNAKYSGAYRVKYTK